MLAYTIHTDPLGWRISSRKIHGESPYECLRHGPRGRTALVNILAKPSQFSIDSFEKTFGQFTPVFLGGIIQDLCTRSQGTLLRWLESYNDIYTHIHIHGRLELLCIYIYIQIITGLESICIYVYSYMYIC